MFDRSWLPPAAAEAVVIADTHYMLDGAPARTATTPAAPGATAGAGDDLAASGAGEFASRSLQTARVEHVLELVASLGLPVVHLGDIVQEFPERPGFARSMAEATAQIARWGLTPYQVAGNHDVGDKPDPTMPTDWVSSASLEDYHGRFGRSWYGFDFGLLHGIVVNAQIFNSDLPAADEQRRWLAAELEAHRDRRLALFLHIPLYLREPGEPSLGHYDNVDDPDRSWLLDLIRRYRVEAVFAGHSHYAFFNRLGPTRLYVAASTTFSRPGFGEMFSSAPPPDRGRDDTPKLGVYLVRMHQDGMRVQFQRTAGAVGRAEDGGMRRRLVTRVSADLPRSPLGLLLRHPLTAETVVPAAWPSVVRQPVRNDYPLLAASEVGARTVLVPATDLDDPVQANRLAVLADEGVDTTAWALWHRQLTPALEALAADRGLLTGAVVHLLGSRWPDRACLDTLATLRESAARPVTLSTIVARERVPGKQHDRARYGYRPTELAELRRRLRRAGPAIDRVLCRVDPDASPWDALLTVTADDLGLPITWLIELSTEDDDAHLVRVAEALFAVAARPDDRVVVDPFVDLDRTMDTFHGLLDRRCNPRAPFHAARAITTVLFGEPASWSASTCQLADAHRWIVRRLVSDTAERWLIVPLGDGAPGPAETVALAGRAVRLVRLRDATIAPLAAGEPVASRLAADGPTLAILEPTHQ